jgi:hypothetical protein
MPSQSNGIIVRDSSQSEFCNTIGGKADIERAFFGAVAARLFSEKDFCRTPLLVLLSAMRHRTAYSRTKYDERYYR